MCYTCLIERQGGTVYVLDGVIDPNKYGRSLFVYLAGSRAFGLDTENSDFDYVVVYYNPSLRVRVTNEAKKFTYVEEFDNGLVNGQIEFVELGDFLHGCESGELKYVELLESVPVKIFDRLVYRKLDDMYLKFVRHYRNGVYSYPNMFLKEINRRYNKVFFKLKNPNVKNFNQDVGFDTKFAAHLYRVVMSAINFTHTRSVMTDFSDIREKYFEIRNGKYTIEEFQSMIDPVINLVNAGLNAMQIENSGKNYTDELYKEIILLNGWS